MVLIIYCCIFLSSTVYGALVCYAACIVLNPWDREGSALWLAVHRPKKKKRTPWSKSSERTIPTERPPLVGE
jgi:hypothetical protein